MRYHYVPGSTKYYYHGILYECDHPNYSRCTLYLRGKNGLAVIQQRYDPATKCTWWTEIDPGLANDIYANERFDSYFKSKAGIAVDGLYPTVSVRQIMWGLRMKPLPRKPWETVFDKCPF